MEILPQNLAIVFFHGALKHTLQSTPYTSATPVRWSTPYAGALKHTLRRCAEAHPTLVRW